MLDFRFIAHYLSYAEHFTVTLGHQVDDVSSKAVNAHSLRLSIISTNKLARWDSGWSCLNYHNSVVVARIR